MKVAQAMEHNLQLSWHSSQLRSLALFHHSVPAEALMTTKYQAFPSQCAPPTFRWKTQVTTGSARATWASRRIRATGVSRRGKAGTCRGCPGETRPGQTSTSSTRRQARARPNATEQCVVPVVVRSSKARVFGLRWSLCAQK